MTMKVRLFIKIFIDSNLIIDLEQETSFKNISHIAKNSITLFLFEIDNTPFTLANGRYWDNHV
jgi:hypothetical protein